MLLGCVRTAPPRASKGRLEDARKGSVPRPRHSQHTSALRLGEAPEKCLSRCAVGAPFRGASPALAPMCAEWCWVWGRTPFRRLPGALGSPREGRAEASQEHPLSRTETEKSANLSKKNIRSRSRRKHSCGFRRELRRQPIIPRTNVFENVRGDGREPIPQHPPY